MILFNKLLERDGVLSCSRFAVIGESSLQPFLHIEDCVIVLSKLRERFQGVPLYPHHAHSNLPLLYQ